MPWPSIAPTVASAAVMDTAGPAGVFVALAIRRVCRSGPCCRGPARLDKADAKCAFRPPLHHLAESFMHRYRTHTCGALRDSDIGTDVRLSGWCHRIRDHGGLLFIDLRDHYGVTQVVADPDSPSFKEAEKLRSEWVVRVDGKVRRRPAGTENPELPTGAVELYISEIEVLGPSG